MKASYKHLHRKYILMYEWESEVNALIAKMEKHYIRTNAFIATIAHSKVI